MYRSGDVMIEIDGIDLLPFSSITDEDLEGADVTVADLHAARRVVVPAGYPVEWLEPWLAAPGAAMVLVRGAEIVAAVGVGFGRRKGGLAAGGMKAHVPGWARGRATRGDEVVVHTRRDDPALPRRVGYSDRVEVDHVDAGPPEPMPKDDLLPHMDAFDVLVELSKAIPSSIVHDIEEFDMQRGHVKINGLVSSTADAQLISGAMQSHRCLSDVKISKITQAVNIQRQKYVLEFAIKCPEDDKHRNRKGETAPASSEEKP